MALTIPEILSLSAVKVPLEAMDKQSAIFELVDLLASADLIANAEKLKEVVWDRERQRSTGIGEGLAIPHGKSTCSERIVIALGRPEVPIDFDSIDRKPVKLIVLLASPPDKTADHIQALGRVSRLMSNAELREKAYHAESSEELYRLFVDGDSAAR